MRVRKAVQSQGRIRWPKGGLSRLSARVCVPITERFRKPPRKLSPSALAPPSIAVEQVSAEEAASPHVSRPWWKDKIIVFGGGAPLLGLALFLGFLVWGRSQPHVDQDRLMPEPVGRAFV